MPAHPATPAEPHSPLNLERIVFFSDAVMAIAITLLAIDLRVPELARATAAAELPRYLAALAPRIASFVISFVVIGIYWSSHHRYFGYIQRYDGRLIALNLAFLLFIALMPFVANVLGQYNYLPQGVILYSGAVAATGYAIGLIWWYATHNHRLVAPNLDAAFIRERNLVALIVPTVFLISIPFAFIHPLATMIVWWAGPVIAIGVPRLLEHARRPARTAHKRSSHD